MALIPAVGSSPACAGLPVAQMRYLKTPLRAVFRAPSELGSRTKTLEAVLASLSIRARELGLPSSSSELQIKTTDFSMPRASRSDRTAQKPCTRPHFISNTPGPEAIPS